MRGNVSPTPTLVHPACATLGSDEATKPHRAVRDRPLTGVLLAALIAAPLPLADLSDADVATRAEGDGRVLDRVVRRAHWLVDLALTSPSSRPPMEVAADLVPLVHALDGAQAWWGVEADRAGVQSDKAYALHCAARLAVWSLVVAGSDALHDVDVPGLAPLRAVATDPTLLHSVGHLRRRWRSVRGRLRDRKADRGRGVAWTIPYIERQSRLLSQRRRRDVGRPAPTAPPRLGRLLAGRTRAAAWPAGTSVARHDVEAPLARVADLSALARPGDVIVARRRNYVGAAPGPSVAVVLGRWADLDGSFRGDREAGLFMGRRGVPNRKPTLYMHLRFPQLAERWRAMNAPAAVTCSQGDVALSTSQDALWADETALLRPDIMGTDRLRAVALAAHHVGRKLDGPAFLEACFGPGDGRPGLAVPDLEALRSGTPRWKLVASIGADP